MWDEHLQILPRQCARHLHPTGMGDSFDRATPEKTDATLGARPGLRHRFQPVLQTFFRDSVMYVLEFRLEGGDTVHQRLERIDYIVGSGQHTNSHIVDFNGYIYQAPITYYTQEGRWDMAPASGRQHPLRSLSSPPSASPATTTSRISLEALSTNTARCRYGYRMRALPW